MNNKILVLLFSLIVLVSCENKQHEDFVYMEKDQFYLKNEPYFPVMINYVICFREIQGEITVSPIPDYDIPDQFEGNSIESVHKILEGHFKIMKEMGFNSIRLIGVNTMDYDDDTKEIGFQVYKPNGKIELYPFSKNSKLFFKKLNVFLDMADKYDLKIMMLNPRPLHDETMNNSRLEFIVEMLKEYKKNPTIFSYDFFNEPLYFDNKDLPPNKRNRTKESAYKIVSEWKEIMQKHAPHQLMTIGFGEPLEVFEWDPSILPVDFVQIHSYRPLKIPNEMYWYQTYIGKPWMLGETALAADNDSITYKEMEQFIKESYKTTVDCGGIGYGFWQYQDVSWGGYDFDHSAFIDHKGKTYTKDKENFIYGTIKVNIDLLDSLRNYKAKDKCTCNVNYQNMFGYNNYVVKGKVIDVKTGKPTEGAVIRGWTKNWAIGHQTFSDKDGDFKLFSNDKFAHFKVSAPGMTTNTFDLKINYTPTEDHGLTYEVLPNKDLDIHDISFQSFIKDKNSYYDRIENEEERVIFDLDESLFNKAKFEGKMEPVKIKKLDFLD